LETATDWFSYDSGRIEGRRCLPSKNDTGMLGVLEKAPVERNRKTLKMEAMLPNQP
jgi:hypothetical protein